MTEEEIEELYWSFVRIKRRAKLHHRWVEAMANGEGMIHGKYHNCVDDLDISRCPFVKAIERLEDQITYWATQHSIMKHAGLTVEFLHDPRAWTVIVRRDGKLIDLEPPAKEIVKNEFLKEEGGQLFKRNKKEGCA